MIDHSNDFPPKNFKKKPNNDNEFLLEKYLIALTKSSETSNPINQKVKENIRNISQSARNKNTIEEIEEEDEFERFNLYNLNISNNTPWRD